MNHSPLLKVGIFLTFLAVFYIISSKQCHENITKTVFSRRDACEHLLKETVVTAKGNVSYATLLTEIYEPLGYTLNNEAECPTGIDTLLPLNKVNDPSCTDVFKDWQATADKWTNDHSDMASDQLVASKEISAALVSNYLLDDYVDKRNWYVNEIAAQRTNPPWTKKMIDAYFTMYKNKNFVNIGYGPVGSSVYYSTAHFKPTNMTGIVIGSQAPWVEAACLYNGAKKVITVEYANIQMQHPQLQYVHPIELSKTWQKYTNLDFAVSFSSIEHSGLGRYGDPMDPIGDLREVEKVRCLLKPGGLFYLGLPNGPDQVVFNVHRIYGDIRWPLVAAGWDVLGVFRAQDPAFHTNVPHYKRRGTYGSDYDQFVYVLKKR